MFKLSAAAVLLTCAAPAFAGASADFSGCDGLKKPKSSDDGMRGEATFSIYENGRGLAAPWNVMQSCTRALERGDLHPEQTLRLAHLLRARAAARIALKKYDEALADLDAADEAAQEYEGDFFYERSMGISLDLLRAIVLSEQGEREAALALAQSVRGKRPYAIEVNRVATALQDINLPQGAPRDEIWEELSKIDPKARLRPRSDGPSDLAGVAGNAPATLPRFTGIEEYSTRGGGELAMVIDAWAEQYRSALGTAYALAASGAPERGDEWLDHIRTSLDQAASSAAGGGSRAAFYGRIANGMRKRELDPMARLAEARIAIANDNAAVAAGLLEEDEIAATPMAEELHRAYAIAQAASDAPLPTLAALGPPPEVDAPDMTLMAKDLMLRPESERKLIDYKQSRPDILGGMLLGAFAPNAGMVGGMIRTNGFRSTEQESGTIKVEYIGNTTIGAAVQEMTLLRAAEIAQEAGASRFLIESRMDDAQYRSVNSAYGAELARTLSGYKSALFIRVLTGDDAGQDTAIDAVEVIDRLGPIYYSET